MNYVEENQITSNQQWGFQKGISTYIAIGKFLEQVIKRISNIDIEFVLFWISKRLLTWTITRY